MAGVAAKPDETFSSAVRLALRFDTGTVVALAGLAGIGLVGRDPVARPGERVGRLVTVNDRSVSKTHFEFGVDARGAWVLDRGSKNGCAIVAGDRKVACPPGQRVRVQAGEVLLFGARRVEVVMDAEQAGGK